MPHAPSTGSPASLNKDGRQDEAVEVSRRAVTGLTDGTPQKARALGSLALDLAFHSEWAEAEEIATAALVIAEPLQEWEAVLSAFGAISIIRDRQGRLQEELALRERALALALEHDLIPQALVSYNNLANISLQADRFAETIAIAEPGLALATERGNRNSQQMLTVMIATAQVAMGRWDELPQLTDTGELPFAGLDQLAYLPALARFHAARGESDTCSKSSHSQGRSRAPATARLPPHRLSPGRSRSAPSATTPKPSRPHCRSPPAHPKFPTRFAAKRWSRPGSPLSPSATIKPCSS